MPRFLSTRARTKTILTAFCLSLSALILPALAQQNNQAELPAQISPEELYPDVATDHWARQALDELAHKYGLMMGYPDGSFAGNRALTRYEMAALLKKLLDRQPQNASAEDKNLLQKIKAELSQELGALETKTAEELELIYDRLDLVEATQQDQAEGLLEQLGLRLPFKLSGDLAFRYEHAAANLSDFDSAITSTPQTRMTLSLDSIDEQSPFAYGARLSLGSLRNPANPWWRLGDYFARVELGFDRFFLSWRPTQFTDFTIGKFKNIYSNSELFMDVDVQPEGAFQRLHFSQITPFWESASLTLGETIINMNSLYQGNIFLLSAKGDSRFNLTPNLSLDLSAAYHHWVKEDLLSTSNSIANTNNQGLRFTGNRASNTPGTQFGIINGFARLTWNITDSLPLSLSADYLNNLLAPSQNQALEAGVKLGALRSQWDWQLAYLFKYLEADASVSHFVEDQLGGTDVIAHEGQALLKVWDTSTLFLTYQLANGLRDSANTRHTLRLGIHQSF